MKTNILYTDFQTVHEIIDSFKDKLDISKSVKKNNLFKFWKKSVNSSIYKLSYPYSLTNDGILIISCKSSVVANEIFMQKQCIISKLNIYAQAIELIVYDIKTDLKTYNSLDQNYILDL